MSWGLIGQEARKCDPYYGRVVCQDGERRALTVWESRESKGKWGAKHGVRLGLNSAGEAGRCQTTQDPGDHVINFFSSS